MGADCVAVINLDFVVLMRYPQGNTSEPQDFLDFAGRLKFKHNNISSQARTTRFTSQRTLFARNMDTNPNDDLYVTPELQIRRDTRASARFASLASVFLFSYIFLFTNHLFCAQTTVRTVRPRPYRPA